MIHAENREVKLKGNIVEVLTDLTEATDAVMDVVVGSSTVPMSRKEALEFIIKAVYGCITDCSINEGNRNG